LPILRLIYLDCRRRRARRRCTSPGHSLAYRRFLPAPPRGGGGGSVRAQRGLPMHGPSPRCGARKRTFAPGVEALEDRSLPALVGPTLVAPGVVQFTATGSGNNTLNIFDDGVGDLSFSTSSTAKPTVVKGNPIHEIIYNAGPGSDT